MSGYAEISAPSYYDIIIALLHRFELKVVNYKPGCESTTYKAHVILHDGTTTADDEKWLGKVGMSMNLCMYTCVL